MVTMMVVLVCQCQSQKTAFGSRLSPSSTGYRDQTQGLRPGKGFSQLNHCHLALACFLRHLLAVARFSWDTSTTRCPDGGSNVTGNSRKPGRLWQ